MAERKYMESIIRILGTDIDGAKTIDNSLRGIKGINHRFAGIISKKFLKENNLPANTKAGDLDKGQIEKLEDIIINPKAHKLPAWTMNRQRDYETGEDKHNTMNDLDFSLRNDNQRLAEIKSYRGLRKTWGLTVRGQKTRSTHRKGGAVGVSKKDTKAAPKKDNTK